MRALIRQGRAERDDWRFAAITNPLKEAKAALVRRDETRAMTMINEAILAADIDARELHKALLLAKAREGSPVRFDPRYQLVHEDDVVDAEFKEVKRDA